MLPGIDSPSLWSSTGGMNAIIPPLFPHYSPIYVFWRCWWRALSNTSVQNLPEVLSWGWDLVSVRAPAYDLHHSHARQSIQWPLLPCGWALPPCFSNHFQVFPFICQWFLIDSATWLWLSDVFFFVSAALTQLTESQGEKKMDANEKVNT